MTPPRVSSPSHLASLIDAYRLSPTADYTLASLSRALACAATPGGRHVIAVRGGLAYACDGHGGVIVGVVVDLEGVEIEASSKSETRS